MKIPTEPPLSHFNWALSVFEILFVFLLTGRTLRFSDCGLLDFAKPEAWNQKQSSLGCCTFNPPDSSPSNIKEKKLQRQTV